MAQAVPRSLGGIVVRARGDASDAGGHALGGAGRGLVHLAREHQGVHLDAAHPGQVRVEDEVVLRQGRRELRLGEGVARAGQPYLDGHGTFSRATTAPLGRLRFCAELSPERGGAASQVAPMRGADGPGTSGRAAGEAAPRALASDLLPPRTMLEPQVLRPEPRTSTSPVPGVLGEHLAVRCPGVLTPAQCAAQVAAVYGARESWFEQLRRQAVHPGPRLLHPPRRGPRSRLLRRRRRLRRARPAHGASASSSTCSRRPPRSCRPPSSGARAGAVPASTSSRRAARSPVAAARSTSTPRA